MSERTSREEPRDSGKAAKEGPKIVRQDDVTQGTEVANLPHAEDEIEEASEESFPASDPPAYSGSREDRLEAGTGASG